MSEYLLFYAEYIELHILFSASEDYLFCAI